MDRERAITVLDEFIESIDRYDRISASAGSRQLNDEIRARLPLIQTIAAETEPEVNHDFQGASFTSEWSAARRVSVRIRGVLRDLDERDQILGPQGPQLAAKGLHPWVWDSAARLWDDGHRREAIQAAGAHIEVQLQAKVGPTTRSGVTLVRSAFSPDPPRVGEPRLRLPQYQSGTQRWTDAHEGAMQYGAGCFMAIRNLATHSVDQPPEQLALEQLAALSVLARWIDEALVQVAP
ncbi:MAG: TIGR02391 family protein [Candidatus Dormiibacterota bacterium]